VSDECSKRVVSFSAAVAARLVRLYPARTRAQYGDDLVTTTTELIAEARMRGGAPEVLRLWPRLLADFGVALAAEYCDSWCASRYGPQRSAYASLMIAAMVWLLIVAASAFDARWAATLLDASLPLTVVLAFGLPAAAWLMSHLACTDSKNRSSMATSRRLSGVATIGSWSVLACHLA
jgi:hypothetical protein